MSETLRIVEPGLLTTVQDLGRYGYQRFGVPVSGAMDDFALRAANLMVGNQEEAAALELTVLGPTILFESDTSIAITGGDLSPALNGEPVPLWQTVNVPADGRLSFGGARDGLRSWLAVAGGIDVPVVMRSRSTYVRGRIGGLHGRALAAGDKLSTFDPADGSDVIRRLPEDFLAPSYGNSHHLRVVLGPQREAFTEDAISTLLGSTYSVSMDQDRMGCRLEGPALEHRSGPDIVSDGSPLGAVQVPGDGTPIVLLADRGTTGGYTKIATVIGADVGLLAQAMPGDEVTFRAVSVDDAQSVLRERRAVLRAIEQGAGRTVPVGRVGVRIDGVTVEVLDDSGAPITLFGGLNDSDEVTRKSARAMVKGVPHDFEIELRERA